MFTAIARLVTRRARLVVAIAVIVAIAAGAIGGSVAERLGPYAAEDPSTESVQADALVERGGVQPGVDVIALIDTPEGADSQAAAARVEGVARELRADPAVATVAGAKQAGQALVAKDGRSTYLAVSFRAGTDDGDAAERLVDRFEGERGITLGGAAMAELQANEQVSKDLARAELLAFPLLFVLSLIFFRGLVAAALPLLVGGMSIVLTFFGLRIASEVGEISVFALNLVTGLGLGLAIDYSLFIVSRYREELERSGPGFEAMRATLATAGRTVMFSSLTVTAALASLLVFPQGFLYSMGVGGMLVSLIAAGVALLVLPAVLALLGTRVNALAPRFLRSAADRDARPAQSGAWYRLSRAVMARPGRIAAGSATLLIVLGLPFFGIKFTSVDPTVLPDSASARVVYETLDRDYSLGRADPIYVATRDAGRAELSAFAGELRELPGVEGVGDPRRAGGGVTVVDVYPRASGLSDETQEVVHDARALDPSFTALTGGRTAAFVDLKQSLADHMPQAAAIIAGATLLVLFLMTGSVVLPLKALLMNVLTLSATFGLLVLIFQDGRFEGMLGYTSQGALEATQPIVLVAVAFGLSTDYGVFLLSRIKEAYDKGASNGEAVAIGLERTGRIVTAAAALFCVAIGAFATSEVIFIKELGVGTALAVLIDATIVRALLVPSLMELLGEWNWWAPRPLRRLYERFGLSEGATTA